MGCRWLRREGGSGVVDEGESVKTWVVLGVVDCREHMRVRWWWWLTSGREAMEADLEILVMCV
jgi:hypothetical protein